MDAQTKTCRQCQMDIPIGAKICGHCRSKQPARNQGKAALYLIGIFIGIPILIAMFSSGSKPTGDVKSVGATPVVAATPTPDSSDLDGKVSYNTDGITITNSEDKQWVNCTINLNTKYKAAGMWKVDPHQVGSFAWGDFTLGDGTRFNVFATKPQTLVMMCGRRFGTWGF